MNRAWIIAVLAAATLTLPAARASAATPTHLTVTLPQSVGLGEDIVIEARLTAADGQPVAGAVLTLFQAGAVGQRSMGQATTDERGVASFLHHEFTLAHLSLRVGFPGDTRLGPSRAEAGVAITGVEVPPSVTMSHTPSPLVKAILFSVLGAVWMTYAFAASCTLRIIREDRGAKGGGLARISS